MGNTTTSTNFPNWYAANGGIEDVGAGAGGPTEQPYPEPNKARIKALQDMISAPAQPMFTPEQLQQRQYENDRDYKIGMLAQLGAGGNQGMEQLGGTLFKHSLAQRTPSVTERGVYDPMSGQYSLNPAAQQEVHRTELGRVEDRDAAERLAWQQNQQGKLDRYQRDRQHATDQMNLHMSMLYGPGGAAGGGGNMDSLVKGLGTYTLDPNTALSRMPPFMKNQVLAQVQAQYPSYDPTTYAVKKTGAIAFGPGGQLGNAMRNFESAGQHLDQLSGLVDALDTGQSTLINKALTEYQKNTGQLAPTNFEAAKQIVIQEVMKAIVANGSTGVTERKDLGDALNAAHTREQLQGVIQQYRSLMNVQHQNLLTQRRAAGIPDETLPNYGGGGAAHGATPGATQPAPAGGGGAGGWGPVIRE